MATGSGSFITENITVSNILCYIVFDSKIGTITTTTINISLSEYRNFNFMIKFGKMNVVVTFPFIIVFERKPSMQYLTE